MSSIKSNTIIDNHSLPLLITSDPDGRHLINDNDEIKIFEWDKHEDDNDIDEYDNTNRLSPVIKDEESSLTNPSNINIHNNDQQEFHNFFPYFISPYYQTNNVIQSFDKISSLETLSKFMSPSSNPNLNIDQYTGISLPSPYSQHWRSSMFPLVLPSFSSNSSSSHSISHNPYEFEHQLQREVKQPKKSHIKKPLNAFMLFMKEQRTQVVQECTLRESAAINQILGRKWHELDRNVQQKYYDMARDERMKHTQLYPGWSARDNYGVKKKQINKGKKRDKNQECLNQKKCRARFGLEQQMNWCKHCKRKKKCLRYTENETMSMHVSSWSDEDDTDNIDDSNDCDVIPIIEQNKNLLIHTGISMDSDEENKIRLLECQQISNLNQLNSIKMKTIKKDSSTSFHHYEYSSMPILNDFKREI